jgi:hypothetical protein
MPRYAVVFNRAGAVIVVKVTADNEVEARDKARKANRVAAGGTWLRTKKLKEG